MNVISTNTKPCTHILQTSHKGFLSMFVPAFSYWLKVPADKLTELRDVFKIMYNDILL